jgi:hypothetical protein
MRAPLLLSRLSSWPVLRRVMGHGAGPDGKCRWCRLPEGWHRGGNGQALGCRHARQSGRARLLRPRGRHVFVGRETSGETIQIGVQK